MPCGESAYIQHLFRVDWVSPVIPWTDKAGSMSIRSRDKLLKKLKRILPAPNKYLNHKRIFITVKTPKGSITRNYVIDQYYNIMDGWLGDDGYPRCAKEDYFDLVKKYGKENVSTKSEPYRRDDGYPESWGRDIRIFKKDKDKDK